jgi:hypothetical protein
LWWTGSAGHGCGCCSLSLVEVLEGVKVSLSPVAIKTGTHTGLKLVDIIGEVRIDFERISSGISVKRIFPGQYACAPIKVKTLLIPEAIVVKINTYDRPSNHCGVGAKNQGSSDEGCNPVKQTFARTVRPDLDEAMERNNASARWAQFDGILILSKICPADSRKGQIPSD